MLRLICEGTDQVIELGQDSISLGRKEGLCDVSINDPSISGLHCQIDVLRGSTTATKGVSARIYDLQSLNGTWVNDERVEAADLRQHDRVRLGSVTFRVESTDHNAQVRDRSSGAASRATQPTTERLDAEDGTSSLTIEIEIMGMIIGPMDSAVVASCLASHEFQRTDKARIVGQRDWTQVGALLRTLGLDADEAEPAAEFAKAPVENPETPVFDILESPVSILDADAAEWRSQDDDSDSGAPPVISEPPQSQAQSSPKVDPIAVVTATRAQVQPRVVVGKSDRRWDPPSRFSIPFKASPQQLGAVLVLSVCLYLLFYGFGGESSDRLPLYGEIQGAGECRGLIVFRPGSELKAPAAIAEIFKGRYFFTKLNGPLPGSYEVVIELSEIPPSIPPARPPAVEGQRPATTAAPDPFSRTPPAAQMTAPTTLSADNALNLNFQFVPNS